MKVLVVLVLAVFTGCNANPLYADKPKSKLDGLIDAYRNYLWNTYRAAGKSLNVIERTEFGQDLSARLHEAAELAKFYADTAEAHLSDETKAMFHEIAMAPLGIGMLLDNWSHTVKKQLEPSFERMAPLAEQVAITLTARAEQLTEMASPIAEMLKEMLEPVIHNMKTHLNALYQSTVKTN